MTAESQKKVEQLKQIVADSNNIVFFGGAGVSTESGIPDFRSVDGLYNQKYKYPPEVMVSHSFFRQHTEEFFEFYKNKMIALDAKPNAAHKKLAQLEQDGKVKAVITQNIDGLHYAAGSKEVLEPDVVLYEEGLDYETMQKAVQYIRDAEVLIIGGTSLAVYPAAGFIDYFRGRHLVVINMDRTAKDVHAELLIQERIGEVFERL